MFHSILLQVLLSSLLIINSVASQCTKVQDCVSDLKETGCKTGETLQHDPEILFGCCPVCLPGTPEAGKCRPPANCLQDGSYAPVQCKGDLFTGRCFCSDKSGNRIFGQMWKSEAAGMTCDCARDTSMYFPDHGMIVVETCESNGNYKTKQNIGDYWYCVDSDGYTTDCTSRLLTLPQLEYLPVKWERVGRRKRRGERVTRRRRAARSPRAFAHLEHPAP
ncbi:hypothetical protein MSG28_005310, partial [Choristoneura fumiferana]